MAIVPVLLLGFGAAPRYLPTMGFGDFPVIVAVGAPPPAGLSLALAAPPAGTTHATKIAPPEAGTSARMTAPQAGYSLATRLAPPPPGLSADSSLQKPPAGTSHLPS